ncbi:ABC transporter substrate-binding protein [Myroides sp. LJL115]
MKSIIHYISIIWVVLTIQGCQKKTNKDIDHLVFRYNEASSVSSLDPAFAKSMSIIWPCNQLFNSLVQLNDSLVIEPDIAKEWSISPDGIEYEFVLRKDVYFHKHKNFGQDSTRNVVASDVVYSLNRLRDPNLLSPGVWVMQNVDQVRAINDSVLNIRLHKAFPGFLALMSTRYTSIVPKEIVEDPSIDFRVSPIGTGPFYFKYWQENVKLILRKNPLYFEKDSSGVALPYLESVAITFLPDKQSAFLQFLQGNIDFVSGIDPSYKDDIIDAKGELQAKYTSKICMQKGPYLNTEYLGFNLSDTVQSKIDHNLRQALHIGFDREKMLLYLRNNLGIYSIGGVIPKGLQGSFVMQNNYDPTLSRQLVDNYKQQYNIPKVSLTLSMDASYVDIGQYLQRQWAEIGVDVSIDILPASTLRQGLSSGKLDFFRASWIADYPDAQNYLSLFYSKNRAPNGPNYTRFSNQEYDELYLKSLEATDAKLREQYYYKMDSILRRQVPVIVLYYDQAVRFSHKNVHNLSINPMNNLFLKTVYKTRAESRN